MKEPPSDPADDRWRPRPHDHLVEPVFGGLGVREGERGEPCEPLSPPGEETPARGWLARLIARCRPRRA